VAAVPVSAFPQGERSTELCEEEADVVEGFI